MSIDGNILRFARMQAERGAGDPAWFNDCVKSTTFKPLPIVRNVLIGLRAEMPDDFAYDEMLCAAILKKEERPVTDVDVINIQQQFQALGLKTVGKDAVHDAISLHASQYRFHPVRDYLDVLGWDWVGRIELLFPEYFGAEDNEYTRAVGRMFIIGMVARIYKPGCKLDYLPIIEGPQGEMKSAACRALGGEWFDDNMPDISSGKEASQHLRGRWLIEVPEMHAMSKAETTLLKSFITRQEERYRPPYGKREVIEPRQCAFIGTTNQEVYLRDETGGRRFWPIKAGAIKIKEIERDRYQLFAEAVALYRKGAQWWPDREFERKYMTPEQEARYETDAWEDRIVPYIKERTSVTLGEIAQQLFIETPRFGKAEQNRIRAILVREKWSRSPTRGTGGVRLWIKK